MTTQAWSTRIRHDSDVMFREWGLELNTKLAACGLVQTSDTGQVNWTTVTRAGTNANAGYEIWRFADSIQATAPIFIRIDYGTSSNVSAPRIMVTVGTGTNGAGTLTGTALTASTTIVSGNVANNLDTLRNSYACHTSGFFGLDFKQGASVTQGSFVICRTVDSSGAADAVGAMAFWAPSGVFTVQALRFASPAAAYTARSSGAQQQICLNPHSPTTSQVGSDIQVYLCWTITPRVQPLLGLCGVNSTDVVVGNTFSATLVGSTPHTYIALQQTSQITHGNTAVLYPAMLWE